MRLAAACYDSTPGRSGSTQPLPFSTAPIRKISSTSLRGELGLSQTASRFPRKGTCLAIYSYTVSASCPLEETLAGFFPWCAEWSGELRRLFQAYVARKQQDNVLDYDDLLLYWRHAMAEPAVAAEIELGRRNIPFVKYGGLKFLEAAHVKDVLAIL
jgi:DNA helicase-2/ATP-dependent DNA helicase PcrA